MINTKITCDNCEKDLSTTNNCTDYRLVLRDESIPPKSGFVTLVARYPSLRDGQKDFCGIGCLRVWISKL